MLALAKGAGGRSNRSGPMGAWWQHTVVFLFLGVTGELSTLRQVMEVQNEPGLCPKTQAPDYP